MDSTNQDDDDCVKQEIPYFQFYTVLVIGTLNDEMKTSATVSFEVTIGPDCDSDVVFFSEDVFDQFDGTYFLGATTAEELFLTPGMINDVPNCPIYCELTSDDSFDPIFNFNEMNGDVTIKSMLASLNGEIYAYTIECISELSLSMMEPETQSFDVEFVFEDCAPEILY